MAPNCSNAADLPYSGEYLRDVSVVYLVFFALCGGLTLATLVMYTETVVFFFRNLYNWKPKDKAKWVLAVYPIYTLTSFLTLMVPRSASVNELVATCYYSVCIYQFVTMLIGHYGGGRRMAAKLKEDSDNRLHLDTPPCCCCCKCLPTHDISTANIHMVQTLVIQYAVAAPVLGYAMAVIWSNEPYYQNQLKNPATWLGLVSTISSVVALWGMSVTFRLSAPLLTHAHIKPKFYCVQLVNMFTNLQSFIINILVLSGVIECEGKLNATAVGIRYHNICLIFEMFGVWILARHFYRRDIKDIPVVDQVYVDTCTQGTYVTGTLDRSLQSEYRVYAPTCAREVMRQDRTSKDLSLHRMSAPPGIDLDPAAGKPSAKHQLKSAIFGKSKAKRGSKEEPYEPVHFGGKADAGVGPDASYYEPKYEKNNPKGKYSMDGEAPQVVLNDIDIDLGDGLKHTSVSQSAMRQADVGTGARYRQQAPSTDTSAQSESFHNWSGDDTSGTKNSSA